MRSNDFRCLWAKLTAKLRWGRGVVALFPNVRIAGEFVACTRIARIPRCFA